jgi:2'-5' RNA ligase
MGQENSKDHTQRLFIAIPVPEPISKKLEEWTLDHKEKLSFRKWTHPRDYHITLQFLGDTTAAQRDALQAALREVKAKSLSLALNGAGTFGLAKSPRVLWAAVAGDLEGLNNLHAEVIKATRTAGFEPEDRPYSPHITLARGFAGGMDMSKESTASAPSSFDWKADRFVLMRTHMHASPMYEVIGEFPLSER